MITSLILTAALAVPAPFPPIDLLVRTGTLLSYYGACPFNTDILEPASADTSYLVLGTCQTLTTTTTNAPSWIVDPYAEYGRASIGGMQLGQCWLIHQTFVGNGTKAMTIECTKNLFESGFEN